MCELPLCTCQWDFPAKKSTTCALLSCTRLPQTSRQWKRCVLFSLTLAKILYPMDHHSPNFCQSALIRLSLGGSGVIYLVEVNLWCCFPWNGCVYARNVFPRHCDCSNTRKNEGFDGGHVVHVHIQRHGKLHWHVSFFCPPLPIQCSSKPCMGSTSI